VIELNLYTDGGSQDNGGLAATAWIIETPTGQVLTDGVEVIGPGTNNQAEYRALLSGLKACRSFRPTRVRCHSDSELMVNQLNGVYRVRDAYLKPLYSAVRELEVGLEVTYQHVAREHPRIQQADRALRAARDASA
jgi:ribonuclease HI